jgi:hypothetical protein
LISTKVPKQFNRDGENKVLPTNDTGKTGYLYGKIREH